jgi:hypothetical protein
VTGRKGSVEDMTRHHTPVLSPHRAERPRARAIRRFAAFGGAATMTPYLLIKVSWVLGAAAGWLPIGQGFSLTVILTLTECVSIKLPDVHGDDYVMTTTYPTDVTDEAWRVLGPLLTPSGKAGRKHGDLRGVVNALLYQAHTGCQWRSFPRSSVRGRGRGDDGRANLPVGGQ